MTQDLCERCREQIDDLNVEVWEETGEILCDECGEAALEEKAEQDG